MKEETNKNGFSPGGEQELELMRKALDASITGVIITNNLLEDNPIIYCNAAFERMTGYVRNEVIGRNCRFLQKEDRRQEARQKIKDAIENGEACIVEIRNYKKNGNFFWNELYVTPIKDANGVVTHFIGIQNDISPRRKAKEDLERVQRDTDRLVMERTRELRESEEYLLSILQTVRECLIVLDAEMKVLTVNDQFLRVFKVSRAETEGTKLYDLGNGQWAIEKLQNLLENVLPSNNPVLDFEVEHDFPHIGKKLMLLNAHRVELEGQYKDHILLAIEDITDRREIERRKDDFLSIASHELKTPLTTVRGFIQLLQKTPNTQLPDQFSSALEKANTHLDRLGNLINELLNVSKIQSGNIEIYRDYFDINEAISETINAFREASKTHRITLKGSIPEQYYGDESQIVQVVKNLISNAIKYSPEAKEVIVTISMVSEFVKISVTDFGVGIRPDEQNRIFQRFYRVSENQKSFPGMGMGLYVCEQIIENHGGTIWVDSEPGKGSTFSFTLPLLINNDRK
ncbi:PAS domain-containing sensor histidine kinase [Desertivirga arenae]|uniref:PAS domain-containing sensor histidine kinase n=1 Tax=Desertivirga arenae TaxID=2810309 RepID=UPI001F60B0A9|nr:PAS domain-containing sensor histidine kinase [Pedobacter sp. SYSU D00823]